MRRHILWLAWAALALPLDARDSVEERLRALEEQNRDILKRLEESEKEKASMQAAMLREQVDSYLSAAEGGQTAEEGFWKQLTRSGKAIQFYGFFRLDYYNNTARADSIMVPTRVFPEGTSANDAHNAFDARLTRFGVEVKPVEIGSSKVSGKLEIDFANYPSGVAESRPTPRIRLAFIQMERGSWTFRAGQDWDVISPLFPTVNAETLMWNVGNLGDRRPQVLATYKGKSASGTEFTLAGSAGLTGAVNNQDLDTPAGERDGFDAAVPGFQVRAGASGESWVKEKRWAAGLWGYLAFLETDTVFAGEDSFSPWCVGLDLSAPIAGGLSVRGEVWFGQALGDVRGNIAQTINTTTGEEIQGWGGWIELRYEINKKWSVHAGGSIDDPDDGDVPASSANLNWSGWVGTVYVYGNGLKAGFDMIYWETQYNGAAVGNMIRFDIYTQFDF